MIVAPKRPRNLRGVCDMNLFSICIVVLSLAVSLRSHTARGDTEVIALQSFTIQPGGTRHGEAGRDYFNVEGKENGKYASFGVLVFDLPQSVQDQKVNALTLTLVQTAPRFA